MPSMRRGRLGWPVAVLVSAALVAGACTKNNTTSTTGTTVAGAGSATTVKGATRGGTLVDLQNFAQGDPDAIDPQLASTIQGSQIGQLMWDMLTKTNFKTGKLEPNVALSWSSNATFTHWDFMLGTSKFSNGDPGAAHSFAYVWNRLASKAMASQVAYHITDNLKITGAGDVAKGTATTMSGLKADDANMKLSMDLDAPLSFLPNGNPTWPSPPRMSRSCRPSRDETKYQEGIMIGNGPYKEDTTGWRHNQDINLLRSETYSPPPGYVGQYLDKISFVISKDLDSAFAAFEAGQGDTGYISRPASPTSRRSTRQHRR